MTSSTIPRRQARWTIGLVFAALAALSACSTLGGGSTSIEVTVSGDGVDQAFVYPDAQSSALRDPQTPYEFAGEPQLVDLPWTSTVDIGDDEFFRVTAVNPSETGELRCRAVWDDAVTSNDSWGRVDEYLVSCSGTASIDGSTIRLEQTGSGVSFADRDSALAEVAQEQQAADDLADDLATVGEEAVAEAVEFDDWLIEITGVDRDPADIAKQGSRSGELVFVEVRAERTANGVRSVTGIDLALVGGTSLDVYEQGGSRCDPTRPDPLVAAFEVDDVRVGGEAIFHACFTIGSPEIGGALAILGAGTDDEVIIELPNVGIENSRPIAGGPGETVRLDDDLTVVLQSTSVDDFNLIAERAGRELTAAIDGNSLVVLDLEVKNEGDQPERIGNIETMLVAADGLPNFSRQDECGGEFYELGGEAGDEIDADTDIDPGETRVLGRCFEVPAADVAGSTLWVGDIRDAQVIATGL